MHHFSYDVPVGRRRGFGRWPAVGPILFMAVSAFLAGMLATPVAAQQRVVQGIVVNEQGIPIGSATVTIVATGRRVLTDVRGEFRVSLPLTDARLQVSRIGYRPVTATLAPADESVRITMTAMALDLGEIVVTGTAGRQEARSIGNAVGRVRVADILEIAPREDALSLLAGEVPGVFVWKAQGNIGTGGTIRVRGVASLNLNRQPLIFIDGVRIDNDSDAGPFIRSGRQSSRMNDINPDDIETIEIIKGPAAATLYGTEAANGVIQIITKKGVSGRPVVNIRVKQGANWMSDPENRYSSNWAMVDGQPVSQNLITDDIARGFGSPFSTGHMMGYSLNVRGGTDELRYFLSAEYDDNEGAVFYNWQRKFSTRVNLSLTPSDKIDISTSLSFVQSTTRFAQALSGFDLVAQLVWGSPSTRDGRLRGYLRATPEAAGTVDSREELIKTTGSITLNYRPLSWFSHRLTVGGDIGDATNSQLIPRHPTGSDFFFGGRSLGRKDQERRRVSLGTLDYSTTGQFDLTESLNSATSLGFQYYTRSIDQTEARGEQFPAPGVETVGGAAITFGDESFEENKTLGMYVQQQLSWKNRMFLTGAVRGDDNSAFGANFDFVVYPKLSASWVLNEEPFWNLSFVSALKLRAAWGKSGQQPSTFAASRLYAPSTGPGDVSTVTPSAFGNADLEPEVGQEIEMGFDAGLLDDRLSLELTYYNQRTKDALINVQLPPSGGFPGSQTRNLGEIGNTGWEIGVDARILSTPDFIFDLDFTFSTNHSEVLDLAGVPPIGGSDWKHEVGFPLRAYFLKKIVSAELDASGNAVNVLCDGGDPNGKLLADGTPGEFGGPSVDCATAPRLFWGSSQPTWEGAIGPTFTIRQNLRLHARVDFRGGNWRRNGDISAAHTSFRNSRATVVRDDPIFVAYDQLGERNQTGMMDAGFARLREVSATYTFPSSLAHIFGASRASLNLAATNLFFLWRAQEEIFGRKDQDPETRWGTDSGLNGYIQTVLPQLTSFTATMRVTF